MLNSDIEFHDSIVSGISQEAGFITIKFSEAYIHKSEGKPGVDVGSGWTQAAELILKEARLEGTLPSFPCTLVDGHIKIDGNVSDNLIPIPLEHNGNIEVKLVFVPDEQVIIIVKGEYIKLRLLGEPKYIEEFPGSGNYGETIPK